MWEKGMGRTRVGRFAAVTVPATVAAVGLGLAITQGMVGAALASATAFEVAGSRTTGDAMELTANYTQTAMSASDPGVRNQKDVMVSIKNGSMTDLCLAADTDVPVIQKLGIRIESSGETSLGADWTDLATESLKGDQADLGTTKIGYAQSELEHQDDTNSPGYAPGGFSLTTTDDVDITGLSAKVYALTLDGLSLANLNIVATTGSVSGTC